MIQIGETLNDNDLLTLPFSRISIDGANVIVERQVAQEYAHGTVKENFGNGDYDIVITGTLQHPDRDPRDGERFFPYEQITALGRQLQKGKALRLRNLKASALGIDRIVIYSFSLPDTPGQQQPYIIRGKSDYPFELILDA